MPCSVKVHAKEKESESKRTGVYIKRWKEKQEK